MKCIKVRDVKVNEKLKMKTASVQLLGNMAANQFANSTIMAYFWSTTVLFLVEIAVEVTTCVGTGDSDRSLLKIFWHKLLIQTRIKP